MTKQVCVFEGDDAAPEAVRPTVRLLKRLDVDIEYDVPDVAQFEDELREMRLPEEIEAQIKDADAILFGAAHQTHLIIARYLRQGYPGGMPTNLRPVSFYEGGRSPLSSPEDIDYLIIRECFEGAYARIEGDIDAFAQRFPDATGFYDDKPIGQMAPGKYSVRTISERNTRTFARLACDLAREYRSEPITVTIGSKSNLLPQADGLFDRLVEEEVDKRPSFEVEHLHADDLGQQLLLRPETFDVIITPNVVGDVLSNVGAATVGGVGIGPSGCYGTDHAYFEPIHGSAPDIAGEHIINPTATVLSAAMMLDYLGEHESARRIRSAVASTFASGEHLTPDQGGTAGTEEMMEDIETHLVHD